MSSSCPACKILLVEADDPSFDNIGKSVNRAVALGAHVVSNSYGGDEFTSARALLGRCYTHPGVAQVASSGDYGFGPVSAALGASQLCDPADIGAGIGDDVGREIAASVSAALTAGVGNEIGGGQPLKVVHDMTPLSTPPPTSTWSKVTADLV